MATEYIKGLPVPANVKTVGDASAYLQLLYSALSRWSLPLNFEPTLGNPASDGEVLASTAAGVRSWTTTAGVNYWSKSGTYVYYSGGNVGIGTATPSVPLQVVGGVSVSGQITSTETTGTAPFVITSTTLCTNLNADLLDGSHAAAFEGAIAAGTTAQYWRGDKTWQTLNQAAVAGLTTSDSPTWLSATLSNSAAAPYLKIINASDTARDPVIQWGVGATPVIKWTVGIDDSSTGYGADSGDQLVFGWGTNLDVNKTFRLSSLTAATGVTQLMAEIASVGGLAGYRIFDPSGLKAFAFRSDATDATKAAILYGTLSGVGGQFSSWTYPVYIDGPNSRVGIFNSTPQYTLDVTGTIYSNTQVEVGGWGTHMAVSEITSAGNMYCVPGGGTGSDSQMARGFLADLTNTYGEAFAIKKGGYVGHLATNYGDAEVIACLRPVQATQYGGGANLRAFAGGSSISYLPIIQLESISQAGTNYDTTKSSSGVAYINLVGHVQSGASITAPGTNYNLVSIQSGGTSPTTVWIADQGGNTWQSGTTTAAQGVFNIATGTAPLTITSTTVCANLNADLLDGNHASAFLTSVTAHNLLSATHGDTLTDSVVAGDILYGNSTPKWARLAKGSDGQALLLASGYPAWTSLAQANISGLTTSDSPSFVKATLTQTTGTAPLTITSTTLCSNLNADLLDGSHAAAFEGAITAGTTAQYWRGDKTWQTLNQAAVAGLTTGDSPTFTGLTLSGLTAGRVPIVGTGGALADDSGLVYDAANNILSVYGTQSTAVMGSELVTDGDFSAADLSPWGSPSGWTLSSGTALHSSGGGTAALTQNITVTSGATYEVEFTIASCTTGSVGIAIGAVSLVNSGADTTFTSSAQRTLVAGASGPLALVITPTDTFNGSIDNVTVKKVFTGSVLPTYRGYGSNAQIALELRANAVSFCFSVGQGSQGSLTTGVGNMAVGTIAQPNLTTGNYNSAIGYLSQYALAVGSSNSAIGYYTQPNLTSGGYNDAFGRSAQSALTTGSYNEGIGGQSQGSLTSGDKNVSIGYASQYLLTTGSLNVHIGARAGYGASPSKAPVSDDAGILIGYNASRSVASATYLSNYVGIGYGALVGKSNQVVIGNTSITETDLGGDVVPITDNAYGLGLKNQAWNKLVLKDTTNGNYYSITAVNGVLTITAL